MKIFNMLGRTNKVSNEILIKQEDKLEPCECQTDGQVLIIDEKERFICSICHGQVAFINQQV